MREGLASKLAPGTCVAGRYDVVRRLGAGSIGVVYECHHRELAGYTVAMKVLFEELTEDLERMSEFRKEVVASYEVNSPHVVRTYEYFRDGSLVAFTMEYVEGSNLSEFIAANESLGIVESLTILTQMCAGLREIHRVGIVHRSLKPDNILLTDHGEVKISDFGIAAAHAGLKPLEHGGVVGSVDYVSPEYLEGKGHDIRSDIYAVGLISYELICGKLPFTGKSALDSLTRRLRVLPEAPKVVNPECPEELSQIVMKALARDPEARFQDVAELGKAFNGVLESLQEARGVGKVSPVDVDELLRNFENDTEVQVEALTETEPIEFSHDDLTGSDPAEHSSRASASGEMIFSPVSDAPELADPIDRFPSRQSLVAYRAKQHVEEVEARKGTFKAIVLFFLAVILVLSAVLLLLVFRDAIKESFMAAAGVVLEELLKALRSR